MGFSCIFGSTWISKAQAMLCAEQRAGEMNVEQCLPPESPRPNGLEGCWRDQQRSKESPICEEKRSISIYKAVSKPIICPPPTDPPSSPQTSAIGSLSTRDWFNPQWRKPLLWEKHCLSSQFPGVTEWAFQKYLLGEYWILNERAFEYYCSYFPIESYLKESS